MSDTEAEQVADMLSPAQVRAVRHVAVNERALRPGGLNANTVRALSARGMLATGDLSPLGYRVLAVLRAREAARS